MFEGLRMIGASAGRRGAFVPLLALWVLPAVVRAQPADDAAVVRQRLSLRAALQGTLPPDARAERWQALAALEEKAGNRDLATEAAEAWLNDVAVSLLVGVLDGTTAPDGALDQLRGAVRLAVATGDRLVSPALVLRALTWAPEEMAREKPALTRALLRNAHPGVRPPLEKLLSIFAGQPVWHAYLSRWQTDEARSRSTPLSDQQLAPLADLGAVLLDERLTEALEQKDLARARRIAELLLAQDRWQLRARVLLHLLDDQTSGRSALTPADVAAAVATRQWQVSPVIVRLARAHAQKPEAAGVGLALGYRLLQGHLHEDARQLAHAVTRRSGLDPELRRTAEALGAWAALEAGELDAYQRWSQRSGGDRSRACVRQLLDLGRERRASGEQPRVVVQALKFLFAEVFGPANRELQMTWAREAALADDPELSARAAAVLSETDPGAASSVQECRRQRASVADCRKRLETFDQLQGLAEDEGGPEDLAAALALAGPVNASWLSSLTASEAPGWTALGKYLERLPAGRYVGTPGFVLARLRVLLSAGQRARARALYTWQGAVLPRGQRLAARLIFDEIARGRLKAGRAAGELHELRTFSSVDSEQAPEPLGFDDDEEADGSDSQELSAIAKLQGALYAPRQQAPRTVKALLPLWRRLDGLEGAELAAHLSVAARAAGQPKLERTARAAAVRLAPGSDVALRLQTLAAAGDASASHRLAAQALLAAPDSPAAMAAFVEAWLGDRSAPLLEAAQVEWIRRAATTSPFGPLALLDRALTRGLATSVVQLRKLLAAGRALDQELEWSPDLLPSPGSNDWVIRRRLGSVTAQEVTALAKRVVAYLDRASPAPATRSLRAWSLYLAGDSPGGRRAAEVETPVHAGPARFVNAAEVGADSPLALLASLRDAGDASFRQKMFRLFVRQGGEKEDLPAELAARAARPSVDPADAALLRALACRAADFLDRARQAIALCMASWSRGERGAGVGAVLARTLAADPEAGRLEGVDGERFFAQARRELKPEPPPELLHSQAVWLAKLQRNDEAAKAEAEAWAAGYVAQSFGVEQEAWSWVKHQPLLARYHLGFTSFARADRDLTLATVAFVAGDVRVAIAHIEAVKPEHLALLDPARREWARVLPDLLALALVDLQEKRLTRETLADFALALILQKLDPLLPRLSQRTPPSYLVSLATLETSLSRLQAGDGAEARRLADRFPANVSMGRLAVGALVLARRLDEARAVVARLQAHHPGDDRLGQFVAAGLGGPPPQQSEPDLVRTAEGWTRALQATTADSLLDAADDPIELHVDEDQNLETFLPRSFKVDPTAVFTFRRDGINLSARRVPRVPRCQAAECLAELAAVLKSQGIERIWSQPVLLPAGPGQEAMFRGPLGVVFMVSVPLGPHLFLLSVNAAVDQLQAALPAIRLFRDTFHPRDGVFGAAQAELLRSRAQFGVTDPLRARARLALSRATGDGCPITKLLAPLAGTQRAELLVDLFLISPRVQQRRRLLRCMSPDAPAAAVLGLAALWDSDETSLVYGRASVSRHGRATARLFQRGLPDRTEATASDRSQREQPAAGLLQVIVALPAREQSALALRFFNSGQPRLRALAMAALKWTRTALPLDQQLELVRTGSAEDLRLLLATLPDQLDESWKQALRARLKVLPAAPRAPPERELAQLLEEHLAEEPTTSGRAVTTSPPWLNDEPLADRNLPAGWSYLRVGRPGTFLAALRDVGRRLLASGDPRVHAGQKMLLAMAADSSGDRFEQSGLDLDRPFECAVSFGDVGQAFVCTAGVKNPTLVADRLAEVRNPANVGVALPWYLGTAAVFLPTAATMLPFVIGDEAEETDEQAPAPLGLVPQRIPAERLVWERLDDRIVLGNRTVARRTEVLVARGEPLRFDESMYFLSSRRLWVFSDAATGKAWENLPARAGINPRRLLGEARDEGATLRGIAPIDPRAQDLRPMAMEMTPTSDGLRVRFQVPQTPNPGPDPEVLYAALPAGAAIALATPIITGPPFWFLEIDDSGKSPSAPVWLWRAANGVSVGWYPRAGRPPAARWVSIVPWSQAVQQAFSARGLPAPTTEIITAPGLVYRRRGSLLILSPERDLIEAAPAPPTSSTGAPVRAEVDARGVRAALDQLAQQPAVDSSAGDRWRFWATVASLVQGVKLRGARQGAGLSIEVLFRTPPADRQPDSALVDEWLRSVPLRNSLALPRAVQEAELRGPIALLVKTGRPEDLRRALLSSRRLTLEPAGDQLFRLRLRPPGGTEPAEAGPPVQAYLRAAGTLPAALRTTAREIVGSASTASDRARAVIAWVHRVMHYEITPGAVDDLELLLRKRGDCTEYSQLTIALLRALQIPARMQSGFMAAGRSLIAHAWVEFHDGSAWREVDPTAGHDTVDAGYLQASVLDVLALVSAGQIEIVALE
jgi:hypothetical protein